MSAHFQPLHAAVKKELPSCTWSNTDEKSHVELMPSQSALQLEHTQDHCGLKSGTTEMEDDKYWPLSGKPYFDMIFTKTHLAPRYQLFPPTKITRELPNVPIPVVLTYCGKSWNMLYTGDRGCKRFDRAGWRVFVIDNNLKIGDCCFFEIMECSPKKVTFRTQILRGDLPPSLEGVGKTPEKPIIIQ